MRTLTSMFAVLACLPALGCGVVLEIDDLVADRVSAGGAASAGGAGATVGSGGADSDPSMIDVAHPESPYRIDDLPVTNSEYQEFLAAGVATGSQDAVCSWNDTYEVGIGSPEAIAELMSAGIPSDIHPDCPMWLDIYGPNRPIACIDWCDARAYCAWRGKRLCGRIGGGTVDVTMQSEMRHADPEQSEWFRACSNAGERVFPYGDTYESGRCVDGSLSPNTVKDVGSREACEGGLPGLFDMSGNVFEFANECSDYGGHPVTEICIGRGGAYYYEGADSNQLQCSARHEPTRATISDTTGFRCCSD